MATRRNAAMGFEVATRRARPQAAICFVAPSRHSATIVFEGAPRIRQLADSLIVCFEVVRALVPPMSYLFSHSYRLTRR